MVDISEITTGLTRGDDGIWFAPHDAEVSYPPGGHAACLAIEEGSFWFNHRNACIAAAIDRHRAPSGGPIFDVGGGNGFVSLGLAQAGFEVVLVEPGDEGATNARLRGVDNVIRATTESAGFLPGSLPAVGLFDVIEHIEDDESFLRSMHELLRPRGILYATVPAYQLLWSAEDIAAGHFRRYDRDSIRSVLERAGFEVRYLTHIFRPLPLPVLLFRALPHRLRRSGARDGERRQPSSRERDHGTGGGVIGKLARRILEPEVGRIENGVEMAFGGSILIVAERS